MDFTLTSEQRLLDDTVTRLVRERWGYDSKARAASLPGDFRQETWALMAELGLLAVPFSEAEGGIGGSGTELMLLHRAFGRGLAPEPYLASIVLSGTLLAQLATPAQRAKILPELIAGQRLLALACYEPSGRYNPYWIETRAIRDGSEFRINGRKAVVLNGDTANQLLVVARTAGEANDRTGISVFLVDADRAGVDVRGYSTIDERRAADIQLNDVRVPRESLVGHDGRTADALDCAIATGCAALCAEAVGAMEVACDLTLEYLKTRQQFGVPIGRFQVLQHRMVDMRIALEKANSMAILAATSLELPAVEREQKISAAKWLVGASGRFVAEQAIQLHGGMGMTDEAAVSHYAKRLVMIDHWLGDTDYHLNRFIAFADMQPADQISTAEAAHRGTAA